MKKSVFICMIALLGITGCGGKKEAPESSQAETVLETAAEETKSREAKGEQEQTTEGDEFSRHFSEITVEGKTLSIPASYEELKECGFEIKSVYRDVINPGEQISGELTHTSHENSRFSVIFAFKEGEGQKKAEECEVVSFSIDADTIQGTDISFYGGISVESTREEAAALLEEVFADEESAQYNRFLDEKEHSGMDVYFYQDRLLTVTVNNFADYFGQ